MKHKKIFLSLLASALLVGGSGLAVAGGVTNFEKTNAADNTVTISSLSDWQTVFNAGAAYNSYDIELLADLDLSSVTKTITNSTVPMAGTYTGTFNGNGHRLYGIGANCTATTDWNANVSAMFNIIGSAGVVKDLIVDWTAVRDNVGPIAYKNSGTFENVTVIARSSVTSSNSWGAMVAQEGEGTYKNCYTHFYTPSGTVRGGSCGAVSFGGSPATSNVTNCYYTLNDVGGAAAISSQSFTQITSLAFTSSTLSVSAGDTSTIDRLTYLGMPVTFSSSDESVATVSSTGVVTGVGAGTATITISLLSDYTSIYGELSTSCTVSVVSGSIPVTGISLSQSSLNLLTTSDETTLTATLTGKDYSSLTWTSSTDGVVSFATSEDLLTATITPVAAGSTTITATVVSTEGTYSAECAIAVVETKEVKIPWADNFAPTWNGGSGLEGVYIVIGDNGIPSNEVADYSLTYALEGDFSQSMTNWWFDNNNRLYATFGGAPLKATFNLTYYLTYVGSDSTYYGNMYVGLMKFVSGEYVAPEITFTDTTVSVSAGESKDITATVTNVAEGSTYTWSSDDENVFTVTGDSTTATVTALADAADKTATLTLTVHDADYDADYSESITISVVAATSPVTAISLSSTSLSLEERATSSVEVIFTTGTEYTEIVWSSSDSSIASAVADTSNARSATITGVATGSATITVAVWTSETEYVEASCSVKVTDAPEYLIDVYFMITNDDFVYIGQEGFGIYVYGGTASGASTLSDTGYDYVTNDVVCSVYYTQIDLYEFGYDGTNFSAIYFQLCGLSNGYPRWGAGINFPTDAEENGLVLTAYSWTTGANNPIDLGNAPDYEAAISFYSGLTRTSDSAYTNSFCVDSATAKTIVDSYNALSTEVQGFVDNIYHVSSKDGTEYAEVFSETIAYLESLYSASSLFILSAGNENSATYIIIGVASVLVIGTIAFFFLKKKRIAKEDEE